MTQAACRPALNGVDVPTLFATLDAVKSAPEIADFQFRARNTWVSGAHNRTVIQGFYGAKARGNTQPYPSHLPPTTLDFTQPSWLKSAVTRPRRSSSCCTPSLRA